MIDLEAVTERYYVDDNGDYQLVAVQSGVTKLRHDLNSRFTWKKCPGDNWPHYWPSDYSTYGPPLVIGFVGDTQKGKSHLLAAMIGALDEKRLQPLGIEVTWLEPPRHRRLMETLVKPFLRDRKRLIGTSTPRGSAADHIDIFQVQRGGQRRTVVLYDVSGLSLMDESRVEVDFMFAVDALLFVVDIGKDSEETAGGDVSFQVALDRLSVRESNGLSPGPELPAAIVLAKSDERQFDEPVMRWMRKEDLAAYGSLENPDAELIAAESADAYAYLYAHGFTASMDPVDYFDRITLHFASAAGAALVDKDDMIFQRGVRPVRVLDPLLALFAMAGVLGANAQAKMGA